MAINKDVGDTRDDADYEFLIQGVSPYWAGREDSWVDLIPPIQSAGGGSYYTMIVFSTDEFHRTVRVTTGRPIYGETGVDYDYLMPGLHMRKTHLIQKDNAYVINSQTSYPLVEVTTQLEVDPPSAILSNTYIHYITKDLS